MCSLLVVVSAAAGSYAQDATELQESIRKLRASEAQRFSDALWYKGFAEFRDGAIEEAAANRWRDQIKWADSDTAIDQAIKQNKPVFVFVHVPGKGEMYGGRC
ncbi:MAG: hypothetical protein GY878_01685 [Fuerstiella sp.]|nr:hypothetical protein [Fuerstiella sp.]